MQNLKITCLALFVVWLGTGCESSSNSIEFDVGDAERIDFVALYRTNWANVSWFGRRDLQLRSLSELNQLLDQEDALASELIDSIGALENIDFSEGVVVLVSAGRKPQQGYDIVVSEVTESEFYVTVQVTTVLADHCSGNDVATHPMQLIFIASRKHVAFEEMVGIRDC